MDCLDCLRSPISAQADVIAYAEQLECSGYETLHRLARKQQGSWMGTLAVLHNRGKIFMATGTVKWFNEQKGYGFIQPDSGGKDVFVHVSAVERSGLPGLAEGQKISYEVQADRRTVKESAVDLKTA
jgi:CspA family cold shock protein